jgi:hypothetical protein
VSDATQDEVAPLDLGTSAVTLVSAAVIAAGPGATDAAVELQMERIVSLANGRPMQRVARWSGAVHFPCVVLGAAFEENTKRWLIRFATRPHPKWNPDGVEEIRCDRNDSGSPVADQIGRWALAHVGSPAWATKVMEKAPDGTPHRVLVALKPSASVADGITVPAGTPSARSGAAGVGVDPTVPQGRAEADSGPAPSRVVHEEPYDPMPSDPASPAPAKAGPSPEQIRAGLRSEPVPAEPSGEDWKRDESAVPAGSPTEQRNRILELAQHIGRADARDLASAAVGYDVSTLIVPELRSAADAAKVITALQNAWNDLQVQRKQAAS